MHQRTKAATSVSNISVASKNKKNLNIRTCESGKDLGDTSK